MRHLNLLRLIAAVCIAAAICPFAFGQVVSEDRRICFGDYAFCSAATCTPTGTTIRVHTATDYADFPAADCTCPVLHGFDEVEVEGGNMQGSCKAPTADTVWSGFWPHARTPQQVSNWKDAPAPGLLCGKDLHLGDKLVNCYSFLCKKSGTINGVAVATCRCAVGETFDGTPVSPEYRLLHTGWTVRGQHLFAVPGQ